LNKKKIEFYSHFEEKKEWVGISVGLVFARDLEGMDIRRMVISHQGESNPHGISPARF